MYFNTIHANGLRIFSRLGKGGNHIINVGLSHAMDDFFTVLMLRHRPINREHLRRVQYLNGAHYPRAKVVAGFYRRRYAQHLPPFSAG